MRTILLSALLLTNAGCVRAAPRPQSAAQVPEARAEPPLSQCTAGDPDARLGTQAEHPADELVARGTGVDAYQREAGIWLSAAPVMVNEDFDFATAMAMPGIGAAIAAGKRKSSNEQRAAELGAFTLPKEVTDRLEALRGCGIHRWGLLWNGREPALLIITDRFDASGKLVESKSASHPIEALHGPKVWLAP